MLPEQVLTEANAIEVLTEASENQYNTSFNQNLLGNNSTVI